MSTTAEKKEAVITTSEAVGNDENSITTATTTTTVTSTATATIQDENEQVSQKEAIKMITPTSGMTHQQHIQTMNTLHSFTIKIQKETRGRRFKEEYKLLDDCLKLLLKMRDISWPFMNNLNSQEIPLPEWMSNDDIDNKNDKDDSKNKEEVEEGGESSKQAAAEDTLTAELKTHPWILSILKCYSIILQNTSKSAALTELTLDAILVLISNGYLSGTSLTLFSTLIDSIVKCSESSSDAIQVNMCKCLLALFTSSHVEIHEAGMLTAVRATFHVYLVSKSPHTRGVAKKSLVDMLKSVLNRMEAWDAIHPLKDSQYHTDSYLLFRALCKLSAKSLPGDDISSGNTGKLLSSFANAVDPMALQSKILSLELILQVLEMSGRAFRNGHKFIYAIQHYLCVSLLKNCMSHDTNVVYLSLKIFLTLVYNFKNQLKSEVEIFVANIFLRVLESPNSLHSQKLLVLEALRALCADPVLITQIFLNYDCDLEADNLYKKIILHMTKLVKSAPNAVSKVEEEFVVLRFAGLEILVVVLQAFLKALDLPGQDDVISCSTAFLDVGELKSDVATTTSNIVNEDSTHSNSNSTEVAASSQSAKNVVEAYDRKRDREASFETGMVKFTLSLKEGLLYFIKHDFCICDAKEIAKFLLQNKDLLDKTMIGECLGREIDGAMIKTETDSEKGGKGFYLSVLYHYVDQFNFSSMEFDKAIRMFLSGFRLPGEAQKIDRIMEKFAERYTRQNEDVFPSADTAFILAFSVIMLNTDLHSPNIKPEKKMTLESFIRNNRGISVDGGDLPDEYIKGIFERIQKKAFTLKEDDLARSKIMVEEVSFLSTTSNFFGVNSVDDRKREKFKKEKKEMMAASELLFHKKRSRKTNSNANAVVPPSDVVKPMFDVTWGPLIGTLSQVLETSEDDQVIALCLQGFVYSIRISAHSEMSLARETFVNSLAKLTSLGGYVKEMKYKDIECIRTLLSVAIMDGEYLEESWGPVLQCISQLARLHLSASGFASDGEFLKENGAVEEVKNHDAFKFFRHATPQEIALQMEETNGRIVLEAVNGVLIDRVFSFSVKLSARGIIHFIEQLILVSKLEISGDSKMSIRNVGSGPRIFALQRLVEVADYNMTVRSRIAWTQIWETMAQHFASIGCHSNAIVSMFAIDALRQLSFKFLEKPELNDFNFQRLFLRPFLYIMENQSSRDDIRELVLRCMDNMIRLMNNNLRSGWKIILECLTLSANDPLEKISTLGLAILQRLLDDHFDALLPPLDNNMEEESKENLSAIERRQRNARVEDFCSLCRASLAFVQVEEMVKNLPVGLSMRALCHISCYADLIALKKILPPVGHSQSTDSTALGYTYEHLTSEEESDYMALWRPIMDGLSRGICATVKSNSGGVGCLVHRGSVMTLRAILLRHGHAFTTSQWKVLLQSVLLPAIHHAAVNEIYPVMDITSDNPTVSSFDFLVEALPLPPPCDDKGLLMFSSQQQQPVPSNEIVMLKRILGPAELLVEASFADLRHGGDGNLSRAYGLSIKKQNSKKGTEQQQDQPFPDSWIATTASISLGTITDVVGDIFIYGGEEGRNTLWPVVFDHYKRWILGNYNHQDSPDDVEDGSTPADWRPCEALVRIACKEFSRIPLILFKAFTDQKLSSQETQAWFSVFCTALAEILSINSTLLTFLQEELVEAKLSALGLKRKPSKQELVPLVTIMKTPYGSGTLRDIRTVKYGDEDHNINEIVLDWGAVMSHSTKADPMISPLEENGDSLSVEQHREEDNKTFDEEEEEEKSSSQPSKQPVLSPDYINCYVPAIKIRCVASYLLQHYLPQSLNVLASLIRKSDAKILLSSLDQSRLIAHTGFSDTDLSHAFQESIRSSWLDGGITEVEQRLGPYGDGGMVPQHMGSEMFFLTQEASANKAMIHLLSLLYCSSCNNAEWDTASYSEPLLISQITNIIQTFLTSEKTDGVALDANIWKRPTDSMKDIAFYCTSFAGVLVSVLFTILKFSNEQFVKHLEVLYPLLTKLISVQSDEVRGLVREIMETHVYALIKNKD